MPADQIEIALVAQLVRIRRLRAHQLQPRNPPAFLVNRNDRLHRAQLAQIVDQLPQLRRRLDVSPKQNERTRLDAAERGGGRGVEFDTGHAGHQELAERR